MSDLARTGDSSERRRKAEAWVNGYTATAVGTVLVTSPIPGAASAILLTLEGTMCYQIGKIYRAEWSAAEASAAAAAIGVASLAGKIAALEAAILLGPFALVAKPAIAAGIVKAMGQLVIKHFEDTM